MRVNIGFRKVAIILIMMSLGGCSSKGDSNKEGEIPDAALTLLSKNDTGKSFEPITTKINKQTKDYEIKNLAEKGISRISGIATLKNITYVLDDKNDTLTAFSETYDILKRIGKTGNNEGEFTKPTAITVDENESIYVVDSGNKRVERFDKDLNFIDSFSFKTNSDNPDFFFSHIAVDKNGRIFLSGDTIDNPGVNMIDTNGKQTLIKDYFSGAVTSYLGEVYAINFGNFYRTKDKRFGYENGENYLLKVEAKGLKIISELPYGLGTRSFILNKSKIFLECSLYDELMELDFKGKYHQSLTQFDHVDSQVNTAMALSENNKLLVSNKRDSNLKVVTISE